MSVQARPPRPALPPPSANVANRDAASGAPRRMARLESERHADCKEFFEQLRAEDLELQREYDRLGPWFQAMDAIVKARKRATV